MKTNSIVIRLIIIIIALVLYFTTSAQSVLTNNARYNLNGFSWYWSKQNGDTVAVFYAGGESRFHAPIQYAGNYTLTSRSLTDKNYVDSAIAANAGGGGTGSPTTDASQLTSGTLNDARLSSNVPLKNASNTWTGINSFSSLKVTPWSGAFTGNKMVITNALGEFSYQDIPAGGSATTDASLLTSGTLADARLSTNVPLKNTTNTFTLEQTFERATATSASFSNATWSSANLNIEPSGGRATTLLNFRNPAVTGVTFRIGSRGSSSTGMTAGYDYYTMVLGRTNVIEAASGTHDAVGKLYLTNLNVTNGNANTRSSALLKIEDGNTGVAMEDTASLEALGKIKAQRFNANNLIGAGIRKIRAAANGDIYPITNGDGDEDHFHDMVRKGNISTNGTESLSIVTVGIPDETFGVIEVQAYGLNAAGTSTVTYRKRLPYKRIGGTLTLNTGAMTSEDFEDAGMSGANLSFTVTAITNTLNVVATGVTSTIMDWRASVGVFVSSRNIIE